MKKIIQVPGHEAYYFCKRLFFSVFGDACMAFANCLEKLGWVGHPYYIENSDHNNVIILYFVDDLNKLNELIQTEYTSTCNDTIIITDVKISKAKLTGEYLIDSDDIIDLTNLEDYYNTELNLKEFVTNILNSEE